jgi:hypothetical protein
VQSICNRTILARPPRRWLAAIAILAMTGAALPPRAAAEPVYHTGTTRKVLQLTGDYDQPLRRPTLSLTKTQADLRSTDLGSSFEHNGKLYFLFGDTFGRSAADNDTFATSESTDPSQLTLAVAKAADGKFLIITVPGIQQGAYEVPSYGISVNGSIYIVHTTDWYAAGNNMERSVLARSTDNGQTWTYLYDLSADTAHDMTNAKFINVSLAEVNAEDHPGAFPWATGKVVLIWGSGAYRQSNVCLAAVPSAQFETKSAIRYFSGLGGGGAPTWSSAESAAVPLFNQPQVGEFSAAWIPQLSRWVMLYNAGSPRGITMRTSLKPWGPWSAGSVIMEPWADGGYGVFHHVPWSYSRMDAFHDSGKAETWGGEYGPYIIPRFTTGNSSACRIYYTMSTWNPYQTVLMSSEIGEPAALEPSQTVTEQFTPGDASWQKSSSTFFVNFTHNGVPHITTYAAGADSDTGIMWRWLPRDTRNRRLQYTVHGGHAEVMVLSGGVDIPSGFTAAELYPRIKAGEFGEVVLCTVGHDANDVDVTLDWDLRPFDRANLKVVVIDHLNAAPWGFVSVSRMTLSRTAVTSSVLEWRSHADLQTTAK